MVEYEYDSVGRVASKVVRDMPSDDDSTRFEVDYMYNLGRNPTRRIEFIKREYG